MSIMKVIGNKSKNLIITEPYTDNIENLYWFSQKSDYIHCEKRNDLSLF